MALPVDTLVNARILMAMEGQKMTKARSKIVDPNTTRWYHCISRCVRKAFLLQSGDPARGGFDAKAWIEERLRFLAELFAVQVGGFSIMDSHFHILLRLNIELVKEWSAAEVVRRALLLHPPRDSKRQLVQVTQAMIEEKAQDEAFVAKYRKYLGSLSWFMKSLKEPLSRLANKADGCKGAFFEGRFKSIAILDFESLMSVCSYIDLNPVAAGMTSTPEASPHTSVKERVDHVMAQGRVADLRAYLQGSVLASQAAAGLEEGLWLIPIEDRRLIDSEREGFMVGFTLGNYLALVEQTGRMLREGKASIAPDLADIFDRLGTTAARWEKRVKKLDSDRPYGAFMAASRERLDEVAQSLGQRRLVNVGC